MPTGVALGPIQSCGFQELRPSVNEQNRAEDAGQQRIDGARHALPPKNSKLNVKKKTEQVGSNKGCWYCHMPDKVSPERKKIKACKRTAMAASSIAPGS